MEVEIGGTMGSAVGGHRRLASDNNRHAARHGDGFERKPGLLRILLRQETALSGEPETFLGFDRGELRGDFVFQDDRRAPAGRWPHVEPDGDAPSLAGRVNGSHEGRQVIAGLRQQRPTTVPLQRGKE